MTKKNILYYLPTYGQLGNQLATLAHLLSFAIEYEYEIFCPTSAYFSKHLQLFQTKQSFIRFSNLLAQPLIAKSMMKLAKISFLNKNKQVFGNLVINRKFVVETDFPIAKQPDKIIVTDWLFRYYDGIKKHQDVLRKLMSFTPSSTEKADAKWKSLQATYPQHSFIGVHVRRGDYEQWLDGIYFYDNNTYFGWMLQLSKQIERTIFIICSNENVNFTNAEELSIVYANGSPSEDLFLLSQCDYIIGPPSTFSSWAAFMGNHLLFQPESKDVRMKTENFRHYYL